MPVLTDESMGICKRLSHVISAALRCTVHDRFMARLEWAWYTLAQYSAVRNGHIEATLLANVADLHDRMLFEWQWDKALYDFIKLLIMVEAQPEMPVICLVLAVRQWVRAARQVG